MSGEISSLNRSLPPLRLVHFFAWMALTAISLALSSVRNHAIPVWWIVVNIMPSTLGATLTILVAVLLLIWRRRGLPIPSEPGHWIVAALCVGLMCSILWAISMSLAVVETAHGHRLREPELLASWINTWGWHVFAAPTIVILLWVAWKLRSARAWCWFFAAWSAFILVHVLYGPLLSPVVSKLVAPLGSASSALQMIVHFLIHANHLLPAAFLGWALWRDHQERVERHWSHWCGVFAWLANLPGNLAVAALNMGWLEYPWI